jgi:DHA1 family bicyclomycin/chloramphenicol resistance-like MFS transporter
LSDRTLLVLLAIIVAVGGMATNLYIPALPAVREHFGASVAQVQFTFSVALITYALGMLAWGPIADRYGRRNAILAGMSIVVIGALIGMTAQSLGWLIVGRAVQAFGAATGLAVARAIISDRFAVERMAKAIAQLAIVSVLTNGISPVIGGYVAHGFGWRAVFAALIAAASVPTFLAWRQLPETRTGTQRPPGFAEMAGVARQLLGNPTYRSCVLHTAAAYAAFLVFVSLVPYVMVSALHRSPTEYGFYYLFIAVGYASGNWFISRLSSRHTQRWMIETGIQMQAAGACTALTFMAIGCKHPLWMFVPIGLLFFGQGFFMPNLSALSVSQAPGYAGVASSTIGFLQQLLAAVCVQLMGSVPTDTAVPVLCFCAGASLLQVLVLWRSPRLGAT